MRDLQNDVIRKLRMPPREYIQAFKAAAAKCSDPDGMLDGLLIPFRLVEEPYRAHQDVSLRYFDVDDVQHWVTFLFAVLPRIVDQLRDRASGSRPG